jgi:hypothetical protein
LKLVGALSDRHPKDVGSALPSAVKHLGEALRPVASNLRQAITSKARSSGPEFVLLDALSHHMGVISQALTDLSPQFDELMTHVLKDQNAGMVEASSAAGRLEQVLSELADGYLDAKSMRAGPEEKDARTLLLGVYRHFITEICAWLEELVEVIANPALAIRQRGIDPSADVDLTVALNLTCPPELDQLNALMLKQQIQSEPRIAVSTRYQPQATNGPGLMGTIGALAFGIGITKAIFGRGRG